jgi:ABC-type lipoprotein export system ATPase subunit
MEPFPIHNQSFSHDYHNFVLQDNMLMINQNVELPKKFNLKSEKSKKTKKELEKEKQSTKDKKQKPFS